MLVMQTTSRSLLRCIASLVGGADQLAGLLQVPSPQLALWLEGVEPVPDAIFLKAADIHAMRIREGVALGQNPNAINAQSS
jgi:hypothetical protein